MRRNGGQEKKFSVYCGGSVQDPPITQQKIFIIIIVSPTIIAAPTSPMKNLRVCALDDHRLRHPVVTPPPPSVDDMVDPLLVTIPLGENALRKNKILTHNHCVQIFRSTLAMPRLRTHSGRVKVSGSQKIRKVSLVSLWKEKTRFFEFESRSWKFFTLEITLDPSGNPKA